MPITAAAEQASVAYRSRRNKLQAMQSKKLTIVFEDAYTYEEKYGCVEQTFGDAAIVRIITKGEAGPNPTRVKMRSDPRIATITDGTGRVN